MENKGSSKFCQNSECEYFPCHSVEDDKNFNCLFCYCPLYALGDGCGGNYKYLANGVKDCGECLVPHSPGGYEYILSRWQDVSALAAGNRQSPSAPAGDTSEEKGREAAPDTEASEEGEPANEHRAAPEAPVLFQRESRTVRNVLLTARNLACLIAAALFCLSFASVAAIVGHDIRHTLRAWAYLVGAVAYFIEILGETDFLRAGKSMREMLMPCLFGLLYLFMCLDYLLEI